MEAANNMKFHAVKYLYLASLVMDFNLLSKNIVAHIENFPLLQETSYLPVEISYLRGETSCLLREEFIFTWASGILAWGKLVIV